MNRYLIIWTYVANYGQLEIVAADEKEAAKIVATHFSADFKQRGTIYVAPIGTIQKFAAKDLI